jgi:hypothetical protein
MTLMTPGQTDLYASVEIVDRAGDRAGDDRAEASAAPRGLREWVRGPDRYRVLRGGEVMAKVPFLAAAAPDVPEVAVSAALTASSGDGEKMSFKVAGTGPGASAKVTLSSRRSIACGPDESLVAYAVLPLLWELRADPGNDDWNWVHTEMLDPGGRAEIVVALAPVGGSPAAVQRERVDHSHGGSRPTEVERSLLVEASSEFSFGVKIDAIGLDASLEVQAEQALEVKLAATLPSRRVYDVAWLAGPWGIRVTA